MIATRLYEVAIIHDPPGGLSQASILLAPTCILHTDPVQAAIGALRRLREQQPDLIARTEDVQIAVRDFCESSRGFRLSGRGLEDVGPDTAAVVDFGDGNGGPGPGFPGES